MKRKFRDHAFRADALARLAVANEIIAEYAAQGLTLTLRQLYYQFVATRGLPNTERSYKNLGNLISDGRLAGLVDWDAIEDRGRVADVPSEWSGPRSIINGALNGYRLPRWADQPKYVELWVEKQALAGVLEPLASDAHVPLMVNKGYSSSSAMYAAAQRFIGAGRSRRKHLLYLGDHDPSGEDMVRDVGARLELFGVTRLTVTKVALTRAQIDEYEPPPNPAKTTDSRFEGYAAKHGDESWEVDALPPNVLQELIRDAIAEFVDEELMEAVCRRERAHKAAIRRVIADVDWAAEEAAYEGDEEDGDEEDGDDED